MPARGQVTPAPGVGKGARTASAPSAGPKRKRPRKGGWISKRVQPSRRTLSRIARQKINKEHAINRLSIAVQQGCLGSQVTNAAFGDGNVSDHTHLEEAWDLAHTLCGDGGLPMTLSEGFEVLAYALKLKDARRYGGAGAISSLFRPDRLEYGKAAARYLLVIRRTRVSRNVNMALGSLAQHARDNNQRLAKSMTEMIDVMKAADRSIKASKLHMCALLEAGLGLDEKSPVKLNDDEKEIAKLLLTIFSCL